MTHPEFLYLIERAKLLATAAAKAAAEGEVFHPSLPYAPLSTGLEAVAWFDGDRLKLKLRHPPKVDLSKQVGLTFQAFFPTPFERSKAQEEGGWITHEGTANALPLHDDARGVPRA